VSEEDLLKDQRGSPAYISPDVLSGENPACLLCVFMCVTHMTHPSCHHCNQSS